MIKALVGVALRGHPLRQAGLESSQQKPDRHGGLRLSGSEIGALPYGRASAHLDEGGGHGVPPLQFKTEVLDSGNQIMIQARLPCRHDLSSAYLTYENI